MDHWAREKSLSRYQSVFTRHWLENSGNSSLPTPSEKSPGINSSSQEESSLSIFFPYSFPDVNPPSLLRCVRNSTNYLDNGCLNSPSPPRLSGCETMVRVLVSLAALTSDYNLVTETQHKCILLQLGVQNGSHGAKAKVSSGWAPAGGSRGESTFPPILASGSQQHSLAHTPFLQCSNLWLPQSLVLLPLFSCLSVVRTPVIMSGTPSYPRIISPFQGPHLNHLCKDALAK